MNMIRWSLVKVIVHARQCAPLATPSSGIQHFSSPPRRLPSTAMTNSSLRPLLPVLLLLLLAAASPPAAAWSSFSCGGADGGSYAANSTYEANLRRLENLLPAETTTSAVSLGRYASRAVGYWPNRVQAAWSCRRRGEGVCAACIAGAFQEVKQVCPYQKEVSFFNPNCTLKLGEFRIFWGNGVSGRSVLMQALETGMIFQAIGLALLFFLFLQAWRRDKGTVIRCTSLPSGDQ
ncbi:hypothetical protein ACP70R_004466 [Stipagrostis hirtigluma subsp. patula]